jgi:hypothetical protein
MPRREHTIRRSSARSTSGSCRSPVRFPVKLGHDYPEFERVVEEREHYVVVEKFGEAARVVAKLDPRSRTT